MNKLRRVRIAIATILLLSLTLLFLDFTGSVHALLGWVASIQFLPALLALNLGVVVALLLLTLLFGRLYCSVICPLGVFQDAISRLASLSDKKHKFSYSKPMNMLRYGMLALFAALLAAGVSSLVVLFDPYSAYGRIANGVLAPIYRSANNILAYLAERADSYAFYRAEVVWISATGAIVVAATLLVVVVLAWRSGRTYCNTICPVGSLLGLVSRFSIFKIVVDQERCNGCRKCVRSCKSGAITPEDRKIDYSRCVVCFNCIDSCSQGAVSYVLRRKAEVKAPSPVDNSKRNMLALSATLLATSALKAEEKLVDGGLALIEDKIAPERQMHILPPGANSIHNFAKSCTGCQLCVSVCPNQILRPSTSLTRFMQPELSFEKGYCRPECTKCSEVCPAGAITPIDRALKSSLQIGHAVLIEKNCVVLTDEVECGNCARHCPVGAIQMIAPSDKQKYGKRKIPVIDTARCIGCGACENLCPARPYSAIYVEGHAQHSII